MVLALTQSLIYSPPMAQCSRGGPGGGVLIRLLHPGRKRHCRLIQSRFYGSGPSVFGWALWFGLAMLSASRRFEQRECASFHEYVRVMEDPAGGESNAWSSSGFQKEPVCRRRRLSAVTKKARRSLTCGPVVSVHVPVSGGSLVGGGGRRRG